MPNLIQSGSADVTGRPKGSRNKVSEKLLEALMRCGLKAFMSTAAFA
jgi:hypothetical protein